MVFDVEFYNWCIHPIGNELSIAKSSLATELFAGILEIERIRAVPHHFHRVDLRETYFEFFANC